MIIDPTTVEFSYPIEEIRRAIGAKWRGNAHTDLVVSGVSNDTRSLCEGSVYVAIRGVRVDGHDYLEQAAAAGASGAIVATDFESPGTLPLPCLQVADPLRAMGTLANFHRHQHRDVQVVGIVGSNGKTTTREMVAAVLRSQAPVLSNAKNNNNRVGVPQTLFELGTKHKFAAVEMGTSEPGEIRELSRIVDPSTVVLTNISEEHLEGLGDIDGVIREEAEALRCLAPTDVAIINMDDHYSLVARSFARCRVVGVGRDPRSTLRATEVRVSATGTSFLLNNRYPFKLNLIGSHVVSNALLAIAVGWVHGVPFEDMQRALCNMDCVPGRMYPRDIQGIKLIDDSYNANPASVRAALDALVSMPSKGDRIACLGDMLDLGAHTDARHLEIAAELRNVDLDHLVVVGPEFSKALSKVGGHEFPVWYCESSTEAGDRLAATLNPGDILLVKGSRGMQMEHLIKAVEEQWAHGHSQRLKSVA